MGRKSESISQNCYFPVHSCMASCVGVYYTCLMKKLECKPESRFGLGGEISHPKPQWLSVLQTHTYLEGQGVSLLMLSLLISMWKGVSFFTPPEERHFSWNH